MEGSRPPPLQRVLLLGLTLLALGALLFVWTGQSQEASAPAEVSVRAEAPDGTLLFFVDPVALPAERANVLEALLVAAERGNVTVEVTYGFAMGAFVTSIGGHEPEGNCGWVWERNGVFGDRAADRAIVRDGDQIRWHWGCEG